MSVRVYWSPLATKGRVAATFSILGSFHKLRWSKITEEAGIRDLQYSAQGIHLLRVFKKGHVIVKLSLHLVV